MKYISYRIGSLWVCDNNISDIVRKNGTPLFLGIKSIASVILDRAHRLREMHRDVLDIFISVKTNDDKKWLEMCVKKGFGLEVVSRDELIDISRVRKKETKTIINGPSKCDKTLLYCIDNDVDIINADSLSELKRIEKLAFEKEKVQNLGIRLCLNPEGRWNKFGLVPHSDEWGKILKLLNRSRYLKLRGLHFHESSTMVSVESFSYYVDKLCELSDKLKTVGIEIEWLDMGGGLESSGYSHKNIDKLDCMIASCKDRLKGKRILIELGKSLVNDVFMCVTKCISRKTRNGTKYLFFDSGVNATGSGHANMKHDRFLTMNDFTEDTLEKVQLHGPMCFPSDIISESALMPKSFGEDDILLIPFSGAYTLTLRWKGILKSPKVIWA